MLQDERSRNPSLNWLKHDDRGQVSCLGSQQSDPQALANFLRSSCCSPLCVGFITWQQASQPESSCLFLQLLLKTEHTFPRNFQETLLVRVSLYPPIPEHPPAGRWATSTYHAPVRKWGGGVGSQT